MLVLNVQQESIQKRIEQRKIIKSKHSNAQMKGSRFECYPCKRGRGR